MGANQKRAFWVFGGLPASCEAVLKTGSWRKDVSIEKFRENSRFGEKLTAVQGIIGVIAGGRIAVCGARN